MGYLQNAKPGIGAVGEYQAAGRPWVRLVTVPAGADLTNTAANANVNEIEVKFPAVTRRVIVRNTSAGTANVHFASLATTDDGAAAANNNSAVKKGKNYIQLTAGKEISLDIKCRFIFLSKVDANAIDVEVIAELTNIQEPYDLNKRGLEGITK